MGGCRIRGRSVKHSPTTSSLEASNRQMYRQYRNANHSLGMTSWSFAWLPFIVSSGYCRLAREQNRALGPLSSSSAAFRLSSADSLQFPGGEGRYRMVRVPGKTGPAYGMRRDGACRVRRGTVSVFAAWMLETLDKETDRPRCRVRSSTPLSRVQTECEPSTLAPRPRDTGRAQGNRHHLQPRDGLLGRSESTPTRSPLASPAGLPAGPAPQSKSLPVPCLPSP